MTDLAAQLQLLVQAQGDPARLALTAVDLTFPTLSDAERDTLKESLEAAAIPHWCDEAILAALLDIPAEESARRVELLDRLNEVERFEARGEGAVNVHEASRLALRKRMASEEPERFRALSARAAAYFAGDSSRTGQVEWIYHRLCAAPEEAVADWGTLRYEWEQFSYRQDRDALALALYELETAKLVEGRARLEVLLYYAENLFEHSELTRAAQFVPQVLALAQQAGDRVAEARAYDLHGETLRSKERLAEALEAHKRGLRIRKEVAAEDPDDLNAQWQVAVAHSRLGDVYEAQLALGEALAALEESSRICAALAAREPDNRRRQRELVVTITRRGDILKALGRPDDALAVFRAVLLLFQELADAEPENDDWQRDLAMAHLRVGAMYSPDTTEQARESLIECLRICRTLLARTPDDARRLEDVADASLALADLEMAEKQYAAAEAALHDSRAIWERLLLRDPTVIRWRAWLAVIYNRLGNLFLAQERRDEAQQWYEKALAIYQALANDAPADLARQRDVAIALWNVAAAIDRSRDKPAAISRLEEASRIFATLTGAAPDNEEWADERRRVDSDLARARAN